MSRKKADESRFDTLARIKQAQSKQAGAKVPTPPADEEKGRSHPANKGRFVHTSLYLSRETHGAVKIALLQEASKPDGQKEDLSELVDRLLAEWLKSRA